MTVHASRPAPAIVRRHAGCSLSQDKPRARCQGYFPAYRARRRRGRTRLWRSEPRRQRTAVARPEAHGDTAMCAESPQAFLVAERGPPSQRDRAPYTLAQRVPCCRLTVKLRGRTTTPDERRGRTLSPGARGAEPQAHHGPLQRLLEGERASAIIAHQRQAKQITQSRKWQRTKGTMWQERPPARDSASAWQRRHGCA